MSDSWRIDVVLNDQSAVVQPAIGSTGAMVIRAPRGVATPKYFSPRQEKRIRDIYGDYSATYPDIWEAIQYNSQFPLWISAPSSNSRHGGLIARPTGTESFAGGVPSAEDLSFTAFTQIEQAGTGDGSTTNFTYTIGNFTDYNALSVDILLDGVTENVVAVDSGATETLTGDNGSGTYTKATGIVDYTFTSAPANAAVVEVKYTVDISDAYFVLFDKSPSTDNLAATITHDGTYFNIDAFRKQADGTYSRLTGYPVDASITEGTKNGFGQNIYLETLLADTDFLGGKVNTAATFSAFVDDSGPVDFDGGYRGTTAGTDLVAGWTYFQSANKYTADLFIDVTADSTVPATLETLRNSYQKYSHYIAALPNTNVATAQSNFATIGIKNRGLSFYWNFGRVQNTLTGGSFWTSLMGRVGLKHAQMYNVFNALQPAWLDENGHGGQLGGGILELAYDPSEAQLETLDLLGINAIVSRAEYGTFISSGKTSLTPLSDYSYIGHSRLADYLIRNIVEQALPFQLTKLNDQNHRTRVRLKADAIVRPTFSGGYLREYAVVCDETNNTDDVLQRREFVLDVAVKFTPFSETIRFVFTNVDQTTSVEEFFGA